jgi:hypothetical protein
MSDIYLSLDQDNELRFNVAIEGSKPGTPKYRLVFEGKNLSYAFSGQQAGQGEVSFQIPSMKNMLKEGTYRANLEVMIDDRYFSPLSFDALFEESVKVTAESVSRPVQKKVGVTASIATAAQPAKKILESKAAPLRPQAKAPRQESSDFIGEMNGKKITAEDLRRILRTGGFNG